MAKKEHTYSVLSTKRCNHVVRSEITGSKRECSKLIKKRLVDQKAPHNIQKCYKHRDRG
jgi:hypothetical protein